MITETIQEKAIREAIIRLNAAGAKFHILCKDGQEHGEPIKATRTRVASAGPKNKNYISDNLDSMQVGDVRVLAPHAGDTAARLQSNICAWAFHKFGGGNTMTTVVKGAVEIMRLQ